MRGLAEILRVKGSAEPEGDARAELDVVGQRRDATVVDFGLLFESQGGDQVNQFCSEHVPKKRKIMVSR
jgi:hypothetical protein